MDKLKSIGNLTNELAVLRDLYDGLSSSAHCFDSQTKVYKIEGPIRIQLNVSNPEAEKAAIKAKEQYPNLEITINRNY